MLTSLKKALNRDKVNTAVMEKALASVKDADVKDMFLDDVDSYLDGAEDDSSIGDLVDEIPEYDDEDVDDDDLEALDDISESMLAKIPDTVLTEDYSVYHGLLVGNGQFSDTLYDTIDDQTEDAPPKGEDEYLTTYQSKSLSPATTTNLIYDGNEELNESFIADIVRESDNSKAIMHQKDILAGAKKVLSDCEKELETAESPDRRTKLQNRIISAKKNIQAIQDRIEKYESTSESFDSIEDLVNASN